MAEHKKPAKSKEEKPKAEKDEKKPAAKATETEKSPSQAPAAGEPKQKKAAAAQPQEKVAPAAEKAPENLSLDADAVEAPKIVKAKGAKNIHSGIAHVYATFNNTIVTITDLNGNVIGWSSAGKVGLKGSRKGAAYAAPKVAQG